jgi:leucyl aminopeptidase
MHASATTDAPAATKADTIAVGVFDDEGIAHDLEGAPLGALIARGEARTAFKHLALHHADGRRWLVVGLGARDRFDPERARLAAAAVHGRARELGTHTLCWELPHHVPDEVAAALVEGTFLAAYRFDRYRARPNDDEPRELDEVIVSAARSAPTRRTSPASWRTRRPTTSRPPPSATAPARSPAWTSRSTGASGWPSRAWAPSWPSPRAQTTSPR